MVMESGSEMMFCIQVSGCRLCGKALAAGLPNKVSRHVKRDRSLPRLGRAHVGNKSRQAVVPTTCVCTAQRDVDIIVLSHRCFCHVGKVGMTRYALLFLIKGILHNG